MIEMTNITVPDKHESQERVGPSSTEPQGGRIKQRRENNVVISETIKQNDK